MRSTLSTVSRSANMTPGASSIFGRPLGNQSCITRYWVSSALTNGATKVPLAVLTESAPSKPSALSISITFASGRGVILSIIVQGKPTLSGSFTYFTKPASATPRAHHCSAKALMASYSRVPLWEQLSMLTMAMGSAPA